MVVYTLEQHGKYFDKSTYRRIRFWQKKIIFSDEAHFDLSEYVNRHTYIQGCTLLLPWVWSEPPPCLYKSEPYTCENNVPIISSSKTPTPSSNFFEDDSITVPKGFISAPWHLHWKDSFLLLFMALLSRCLRSSYAARSASHVGLPFVRWALLLGPKHADHRFLISSFHQ